MVFTSSAMAQLRAISNLSSAEEFIAHYGSHIQTGRFQLGGILWRKIRVTSEKQATHQVLKKLADKWLNEEGSFFGSCSVTTSSPLSSSSISSVTIGSEYEALGPAVFNPSLFKQTLLSKSNIWQVIDRGGLDSLVPIWEVALGLHPDLIQQC